jgi:hypothetical protein
LVMDFAQIGAVKLGWSSLWCSNCGVQVGVCRSSVVNSWFPFFGGVSLSPPRQGESTRNGNIKRTFEQQLVYKDRRPLQNAIMLADFL